MRLSISTLLALVLVPLVTPARVRAQPMPAAPMHLEPSPFTLETQTALFAVDFQERAALESGTRTLGLFAAGVVGSLAGGHAGAWLGRSTARENGMFTGLRRSRVWVGALVGSVLGTTLSVHVVNGGRGGIANPLAGAVLGTGAGLGLAVASNDVGTLLPAVVIGEASLAAIFASAGGGTSHSRIDRPFQVAVDEDLERGSDASWGAVLVGAYLGATAGAFGGGWLGYHAREGSGGEDPEIVGMVYGGVLGAAVGAPVGAKVVTSPNGRFVDGLWGSLLGGLVGLGVGAATGDELTGIFLAPVLEIIGATIMMRRS